MTNSQLLKSFTLSIFALTSAVANSSPSALASNPVLPAGKAPIPAPTRTVELNLDRAIAIPAPIPQPHAAGKFQLKATVFTTPDHKTGWQISLPGEHPIATPAFWNNMIFVGGGYGSHEFYAFNAETGALVWKYKTDDDGPTAAVVEDGLCAFNTESCTVFVLDAKTGKLVWKEWLGDPLMSQPAISKGKLYMVYPGNQGDHHQNSIYNAKSDKSSRYDSKYSHRLLCADLKTGKHLWVAKVTADAITAPVINNNQVLLTCQDGTSFSIDAQTGKELWQKSNASTSAPLATRQQGIIFTERQTARSTVMEGLKTYHDDGRAKEAAFLPPPAAAPYLQKGSAINGLARHAMKAMDSAVGFASAPQSAQLDKAVGLPIDNVVGGWAYQGSRVAAKGDALFYNNGTAIKKSQKNDAQQNWIANFKGKDVVAQSQLFSPPAIGKENLYLASSNGHIIAVNQKSGAMTFDYATHHPITFQPALANGNVYVGTSNGMLICLKTGAKDATDWTAWGGNAQHNKDE